MNEYDKGFNDGAIMVHDSMTHTWRDEVQEMLSFLIKMAMAYLLINIAFTVFAATVVGTIGMKQNYCEAAGIDAKECTITILNSN